MAFNLIAEQKVQREIANQRLTSVANLISSSEGRFQLASSLAEPLRDFRDYTGIARRAFRIDELAQGELPYYDKDIDTPSFIIGEEGTENQVIIRGKRVMVPLFMIASYLQIPITQIREKRYDLQARVKEKAKSELIRKEDQFIFGLFKSIISNPQASNTLITTTSATISIDTFSEAKAQIERHGDVKAVNMFINPVHQTILRKMNKERFIDFTTTKELLDMGTIGSIFGMSIHTSVEVPEDMIYITAEPEFFGHIPVGYDITVLNADEPKENSFGFSIFEQIGVHVNTDKNIAAIKIN